MKKLFLIFAGLSGLLFFTIVVGKSRTDKAVADFKDQLGASPSQYKVHYEELNSLPAPVARYFRYALQDGQPFIASAVFQQSGSIRTSFDSDKWMNFSATQVVSPFSPGFLWDAKIFLVAKLFHIRVLDSYMQGTGSGQVKIFSTFTVASDTNKPELNSGALHRYLAEGAWTPTLLLPQSGVRWSAIDDNRALAVFTNKNISVSLEFRFNEKGEIMGIYSPGRWGTFNGAYKQVAWEGHFSNYQSVQGMRIPFNGEVGWYDKGKLNVVWKGRIDSAQFKF